jgi:hypothetical protein
MNRVQNEVSKVSHEERQQRLLHEAQQRLLHEAQQRNHQIEHDGCHKWVRLSKGGNNLRLLCRIDEKGNLLPKEQERIRKVKQALGIK